jgi:hypothetical protein
MTPRQRSSAALNGIIRAAQHNGRDGANEMADAVHVHTAGLTNDELRGVITGLAGFAAAAIQHTQETSK